MSPPAVLLLHGYATDPSRSRASPHEFGTLLAALRGTARFIVPRGPAAVSRERLSGLMRAQGASEARIASMPPEVWTDSRCWVDHYTDDYAGLEASLALLRSLFVQHRPVGVIGYSNGGLMAYLLAAARQAGDPALASLRWCVPMAAVCDARAQAHIRRLLGPHPRVEGVRFLCFASRADRIVAGQGALVEALLADARQVFYTDETASGGHGLPTRLAAWAPVRDFVTAGYQPST